MSEWWSYRLSDFLMFSPQAWGRLLELYNAAIWPMQAVGLALGLVAIGLALKARNPDRWLVAILAACWAWVAWAFHLRHHATINLAAGAYAAGFAAQALLLGLAALRGRAAAGGAGGRPAQSGGLPGRAAPASELPGRPAARWRRPTGLALLAIAVAGWPLLGALAGRPLAQAEVFGVAPDPTVAGTLGVLLLVRRPAASFVSWPLPLAWCAVSGATQWALGMPQAWILPAIGLVALAAAIADAGTPRGASMR